MILFPKLRQPLDISIHHEGADASRQSYIIFRCPLGLIQPCVLNAALGPIISRFTGNTSIDEISQDLAPLGATRQLITDVAELLDANLLLESPRFLEEMNACIQAFCSSPVREPTHAGGAYPSDQSQLESLVNSYLLPVSTTPPPQLVGLMVPHIDFHRGGKTYGVGYSALSSTRPDVIVLLGTAHQASRHLFHLTTKDFISPVRTFCNHREVTQTLAKRYGVERSFEDEFLHKNEHSLELQLPFLHASISTAPRLVPILVGGFHSFIREGRYPSETEVYQTFLGALTEVCLKIMSQGESLLLIAGVDMAHVGMAFGDKSPLNQEDLDRVKQRDLIYLDHISQKDPHALFEHIAEDQDARRMCGFPTTYLFLDLLNALAYSKTPQILDYQQSFSPTSDTCVTYSAMSFPL